MDPQILKYTWITLGYHIHTKTAVKQLFFVTGTLASILSLKLTRSIFACIAVSWTLSLLMVIPACSSWRVDTFSYKYNPDRAKIKLYRTLYWWKLTISAFVLNSRKSNYQTQTNFVSLNKKFVIWLPSITCYRVIFTIGWGAFNKMF